ncbi:MAG: hypothetical protein DIJKHBIC_02960 [Thermoanaerobaculia bacterium]|nr:hypothetical protein [Thermoanaerobaculia bacterium]
MPCPNCNQEPPSDSGRCSCGYTRPTGLTNSPSNGTPPPPPPPPPHAASAILPPAGVSGLHERERDPAIAVLLNFLWTGAGNIYIGQVSRGIALVIVYTLCLPLAVFTCVFLLPLFGLWIWGMVSVYGECEMVNQRIRSQRAASFAGGWGSTLLVRAGLPAPHPVGLPYYLVVNGGQPYGPVDGEVIRKWLSERRIDLNTLSYRPGEPAWCALGRRMEFARIPPIQPLPPV